MLCLLQVIANIKYTLDGVLRGVQQTQWLFFATEYSNAGRHVCLADAGSLGFMFFSYSPRLMKNISSSSHILNVKL